MAGAPFPDAMFASVLGVFDLAAGTITLGGHSYLDSIVPHVVPTGNEFADKIGAAVRYSLTRARHVRAQAQQIREKVTRRPSVPRRVRLEATLKRERAKGLEAEILLFLARALAAAVIRWRAPVLMYQAEPQLHVLRGWRGVIDRAIDYARGAGLPLHCLPVFNGG